MQNLISQRMFKLHFNLLFTLLNRENDLDEIAKEAGIDLDKDRDEVEIVHVSKEKKKKKKGKELSV